MPGATSFACPAGGRGERALGLLWRHADEPSCECSCSRCTTRYTGMPPDAQHIAVHLELEGRLVLRRSRPYRASFNHVHPNQNQVMGCSILHCGKMHALCVGNSFGVRNQPVLTWVHKWDSVRKRNVLHSRLLKFATCKQIMLRRVKAPTLLPTCCLGSYRFAPL